MKLAKSTTFSPEKMLAGSAIQHLLSKCSSAGFGLDRWR
jgi:hypothetical protein